MSATPAGVIPDNLHPQFHGQPILIATSICLPIVLLFCAIRLYTKLYLTRKWGLDDYVFLVSTPAGIALIALNIAFVYSGFGYDSWETLVQDFTASALQLCFVLGVMTGPFTWLVKLTIFCFILTTFHPVIWLRRLVYIGITVTGLFTLYTSIYFGVACGPKGGLDRLSYLAGLARKSCSDPTGYVQVSNILSGAFNLLSDIYILVIPIPAIAKLRMPLRKRLGVLFIFLAGIGACAMSITALSFRIITYSTRKNNNNTQVLTLTVMTIEISVGIIIPTFPSTVCATKHASKQIKHYLENRYGWSLDGDDKGDTSNQAAAEVQKAVSIPTSTKWEDLLPI